MASNDLMAKRQRTVAHLQLDTVLSNLVLQCQVRWVALSAELIKEKGRRLAKQLGLGEDAPEFSNGWLSKSFLEFPCYFPGLILQGLSFV
ncbi:hypothetical protein QYF36_005658 [Acer negundo]|nr:hypothetical protein QYF36_005658 [Acer negundo]